MHQLGFEPTIPVFKREKMVHALDHAATVIGIKLFSQGLGRLLSTGFKYDLQDFM
jgi:hypothetical protein